MVVVDPEQELIDSATRIILRHKNVLRRRASVQGSEQQKGRRLNIFLCLQGLNLETGFGFY